MDAYLPNARWYDYHTVSYLQNSMHSLSTLQIAAESEATIFPFYKLKKDGNIAFSSSIDSVLTPE